MKPGAQRGNWLLTVSLAGMGVGYLLLFHVPAQRALGRLHQDLTAKQDFVAQADALLPAMRITEQQLAEATRYNARWLDAAPAEGELPDLFGRINALARAAGVQGTRFEPQTPLEYQMLRSVTIAAGYSGSFAQLWQFLSELEGLSQAVWVKNLQFEGPGKYGQDVHCEMAVVVFVDKSDELGQAKDSG